jgi:hypothetical protein
MIEGPKIIQHISKILKEWDFNFVDALGCSRGLVIG